MMRTFLVLALFAQTHAVEEKASEKVENPPADDLQDLKLEDLENMDDETMDQVVDKLSDRLLDRAFEAFPMNGTEMDGSALDDTTLFKPQGAEGSDAQMNQQELHESVQKALQNLPESIQKMYSAASDGKEGGDNALFANSDQVQVAVEAAAWAAAAAAFAAVAVEEAVEQAQMEPGYDPRAELNGYDQDDQDDQDQEEDEDEDQDASAQPAEEEELDEEEPVEAASGYSIFFAGLFGVAVGSVATVASVKFGKRVVKIAGTDEPLIGA